MHEEEIGARRFVWGVFGLLVGVVLSSMVARWAGGTDDDAMADELLQQRLLEELVSSGAGLYDSHPDADVGRVMQPNLVGREAYGTSITTNRFGFAERDYQLPKPAGITRVVLLGDSYVFGMGVGRRERVGAWLLQSLPERSELDPDRLEVLHLGVLSWNLFNECAFLRRQLELLQPDLVVHVTVRNDLNDGTGIRGFGTLANWVPNKPQQAQAVVSASFANGVFRIPGAFGQLPRGVGWEGRHRFEAAAEALNELAAAVESTGGRYLHVFHWGKYNPAVNHYIAPHLRPEQIAWLPRSFYEDARYRLAVGDDHWNPAGHQLVARALQGWIRERGLLPDIALAAWPEAEVDAARLQAEGVAELVAPQRFAEWQELSWFSSEIDFRSLSMETASQVDGGVYREGMVAPYASLFLATRDNTRLQVKGRCLERPVLDGSEVLVFLDEEPVGSLSLQSGSKLELEVPIPAKLLQRPQLSVRFLAEDYVYMGPDLRSCFAFQLEWVALMP